MASVKIKRGLQAGITTLILEEGEMAVALDTGNVYIGTTAGKVHINPPGGTADEAVKLKNSREFSLTGDVTSPAVSFNGTQNVQLAVTLATMSGLTAGTYTKLTVDTRGRVTGASTIAVNDLPSIPNTKITGLGNASVLDTGTAVGKVVVVGSDGKIDASLMPALAISETFPVANEAAMLALTAQPGDICIRNDESKSYILSASPASVLANWTWLKTPANTVLSVNGKTGAITLTAADVGAEPVLTGVAAKSTLVDADSVIIQDNSASNNTKKITLANLKVVLKTYFDGLYNKYTHPTFSALTSGLYKVTTNGEGHVTAGTAVVKADITALGIPAQDTIYSLPAATAAIRGGVKVGNGLLITGDVLSVGDVDGGTF